MKKGRVALKSLYAVIIPTMTPCGVFSDGTEPDFVGDWCHDSPKILLLDCRAKGKAYFEAAGQASRQF